MTSKKTNKIKRFLSIVVLLFVAIFLLRVDISFGALLGSPGNQIAAQKAVQDSKPNIQQNQELFVVEANLDNIAIALPGNYSSAQFSNPDQATQAAASSAVYVNTAKIFQLQTANFSSLIDSDFSQTSMQAAQQGRVAQLTVIQLASLSSISVPSVTQISAYVFVPGSAASAVEFTIQQKGDDKQIFVGKRAQLSALLIEFVLFLVLSALILRTNLNKFEVLRC